MSLAGALEEYIKDPNFEQNRIEYKTAKAQADKNSKDGSQGTSSAGSKPQAKRTRLEQTKYSHHAYIFLI